MAATIPAQSLLATNFITTQTASAGTTLNLTSGDTVTTISGPGVVATGAGAVLNAPNVIISTTGVNGYGAWADHGGTVSLTAGTTITTSGSGAAGLALSPASTLGSTLTVTDGTVKTSGLNAYGIFEFGNANRNAQNVLILDHTILTTTQADAIHLEDNGNVDPLSFRNGTVVNPGTGVLLDSTSHGQRIVNLTADGNATLLGNILVETKTSIVNVSLLNNSVLTGAMQNVTNVTVQTGSQWNMTGSSTTRGDVSLVSGSLVFANANTFPTTVQAFVLNVGGNYSMDANSTLSLGIRGLSPQKFDTCRLGVMQA